MSNITTTTELLTPEYARELLKRMDKRQRVLNRTHANKLARDITAGRWKEGVCTDPIDINIDGELQNGQHRCVAVITANKPITVTIRRGCPKEWFEYYDRNKARTIRDMYRGQYANTVTSLVGFAIAYSQGANLGDAMRAVINQVNKDGGKSFEMPTDNEKKEYIDANEEELCFYARIGERMWREFKGSSKVGFAKALWFLGQEGADKELLSELVDDICEPVPYNKNLAILSKWANKSLAEYARTNSRPTPKWAFALTLACWDGYFEKKEIKKPKVYIDKCFEKYNNIVNERKEHRQ